MTLLSSLTLTERRISLIVIDLALVNATTLGGLWLHASRSNIPFDRIFILNEIGWFALFSTLWVLAASLNSFYGPDQISEPTHASSSLLQALVFLGGAYAIVYLFLSVPGSVPQDLVLYQGASSLVLIALWRAFFLWLVRRPASARRVIIMGAGPTGRTLVQAIHRHAKPHYHIVGFVEDDPDHTPGAPDPRLPILGTSRDLARLVRERAVSEVILAVPGGTNDALIEAISECREEGAQVALMPLLFERLTGRVPIEHVGDYWSVALPLDAVKGSGFYSLAKRLFDIVGALVGLVVFSVIMPLIAVAIYLDSPGPIFFNHDRVGRGGRVFRMFKLRTMTPDAEQGGAIRAGRGDPRVTRVGRYLRKTRLDEYPQLVNILRGEMSAVGPRPERPEHLAELDQAIPFHRMRNAVKPGMAGWAALNYGYVDTLEHARIRLEYDLYYIKHQSIWLDSMILVRMFGRMIALKGR